MAKGGHSTSTYFLVFVMGGVFAYFFHNQISALLTKIGAVKGVSLGHLAVSGAYRGFAGWDPTNMAYNRYEPYAGI